MPGKRMPVASVAVASIASGSVEATEPVASAETCMFFSMLCSSPDGKTSVVIPGSPAVERSPVLAKVASITSKSVPRVSLSLVST